MKEIKLKPKLEVGEKVIARGKEWLVQEVSYDSYTFFDEVNSLCFRLEFGEIENIIESPEKCDHIMGLACVEGCDNGPNCIHPQKAKCMNRGCDFDGPVTISDHFREVTEKVDHIADAGKVIEEKPPLKLRVGVSYKDGEGEIEEIDYYYKPNDAFISKSKRQYNEIGHRIINFESRKDSSFNLIEEVQPDKDIGDLNKIKDTINQLRDIVYCQCEHFGVAICQYLNGHYYCEKCKKRFERPIDNSELEALRKENEKLRADKELLSKHIMSNLHAYDIMEKHFEKEIELLKIQNAELIEACKKPQGNPFKVGDSVNFWYEDGQERRGATVISEPNEHGLMLVRLEVRNDGRYSDFVVHHKQCEKVEG